MSSPLRSDVSITQQLDDFHAWLKGRLPQNRLARLDDIFVQFHQDEATIEDIRMMSAQDARDKNIPKNTLDEIKKLISPFNSFYKPQIIRREQEKHAAALLGLRHGVPGGNSNGTAAPEGQDDDDEAPFAESQGPSAR